MSDDPWKGDEGNVIKTTVVCPPGMPKFAVVYSLSFEDLGIDPEKVRKATERMTFLSIDSMRPKP